MAGILKALKSARYVSKIDLRSAYHQMSLEERSRQITAFTVPGKGIYQFKRMRIWMLGSKISGIRSQ